MTDSTLQSIAILVRPSHVRAAGLCMKGAKPWIEHHGMDWKQFVRVGIPVEEAEATGDSFALRAAAYARVEAAK